MEALGREEETPLAPPPHPKRIKTPEKTQRERLKDSSSSAWTKSIYSEDVNSFQFSHGA